ncbi:hypothetical protein N7465_008202 [Penicillium sp. CMV-2018d]|nr:hypothetical protein N7465_008202 [Penicillium sp. CMV-2018d]
MSVSLRPSQSILNIDSFARDFFHVGLPAIVEFSPQWTDRCFFAEDMLLEKGKYKPRWISGLKDSFDGTVKDLIEKLPVWKAKLHDSTNSSMTFHLSV